MIGLRVAHLLHPTVRRVSVPPAPHILRVGEGEGKPPHKYWGVVGGGTVCLITIWLLIHCKGRHMLVQKQQTWGTWVAQ